MTLNGKVNGRKIKPAVTAIIQSRMQSKRLPGKAMLELAGKPILAHVIERSKLIEHVDKVVLATGSLNENRPLIDLASSLGIETYSGSETNVLERYYLASEEFAGDYIVRITGDNPFTDVDYASMIVDIALESNFDLCALANLPLGTAVEVIKKQALDEAYNMSSEPYHFEHVTPFIKEHPELFSIQRPPVSLKKVPEKLRLTVDTQEDYDLAKIIYDNLFTESHFPLSDVLDYVNEHPEILKINSEIKQRLATSSSQ
ncbi:MAG: glycosyltransferase family protein [Spirochaetes bacterium]|nr:glycosyltransferase family protein [Spirochaetota bacterium]